MALYKGRGVRLEVALTFGSAIPVTAVSLANPGVATATAHAQANGTVGYFGGVTGMSQLDGQAIRVSGQTTNTFELEGVDTTNYPAYTAGNFYPASTWATLSNAVDFQFGGGDAEKLDATTLLDFIKQEENGILAAETVSINMLADPKSQAVARIRALALTSARSTWRITYPDSALEIYWQGEPSIPGFNQQKQQIATGSMQCTVKGYVLYL
jgi:hypothetical protein